MAFAPRFSKVIPIGKVEPWDKAEGYTQLGLLPGTTEVIKGRVNVPDPINIDALPKNEYSVQGFVPGLTPPGHKSSDPLPSGVVAENYNPIDHLTGGFKDGWKHAFREGETVLGGEDKQRYARSVVLDTLTNNHPKSLYGSLNTLGKIGATTGRIAGDVIGNGTISKLLWNAHPGDITSTAAYNLVDGAQGNKTVRALTGFGAVTALGIGSGNLDPTNIAGLGRSDGFAAASPDSTLR